MATALVAEQAPDRGAATLARWTRTRSYAAADGRGRRETWSRFRNDSDGARPAKAAAIEEGRSVVGVHRDHARQRARSSRPGWIRRRWKDPEVRGGLLFRAPVGAELAGCVSELLPSGLRGLQVSDARGVLGVGLVPDRVKEGRLR